MRPVSDISLVVISALSFLQCFDTVSPVTGRHLVHKMFHLSLEVHLQNKRTTNQRRNLLTKVQLENSCQNRSAGAGGSINTKYRPRSICITEQTRAKHTINNINKLLIVNTDMHSHALSHTHASITAIYQMNLCLH